MELEDTILSEISQEEKEKYHIYSLLCKVKTVDFTDVESRIVTGRGEEF